MKNGPMILGTLAVVALFAASAHAQEPSHAKLVAMYEGTESCVTASCHEGAAEEVAESLHYQQSGIPQFLEGWETGRPAGMLHSY